MNFTQKLLTLSLIFSGNLTLSAQDDTMVKMPLIDLSAFKSEAGNWQIVGDVTIDPTVDIHHQESEPTKKKKKKSKEPPKPEAIRIAEGTGVLINLPDDSHKDNLVADWTHGDIDVEMEVMLPKGSNSGFYLQGRYEVQLLDSWGVKTAKFSDIGGIYRNWERDPEKSYMGKAPLMNAAKAPGLWQTLKISFRAPRFDAEGNKTENARIILAELNGVVIHENLEIPKPTGGPLENNEVPEGPIMIQGDHGAVAFRNIRYKHMGPSGVSLTGISYEVHEGSFDDMSSIASSPVTRQGKLEKLTWEVAGVDNNFGIVYKGTLNIPVRDEYLFALSAGGVGAVKVDGKEVAFGWRGASGKVDMKEGTHAIEVYYIKSRGWLTPLLSLYISTANTHPKPLHAFSSSPPGGSILSPILIEVGGYPKLIRAFLDFEGDRSKRLTHTIGVGEPTGIHYIYDLKAGNLVCAWKGKFLDATPMWHDRGDGSFRPLGMIQYLFQGAAIATLTDQDSPFPVEKSDQFVGKGYILDESGRPTFRAIYSTSEVSDKITPDKDANMFIRELTVSNPPASTYLKVTEGSKIETLPGGRFAIDDKAYYIQILSGHQPVIRTVSEKKELIIPVDSVPVKYSLTW